MICRLIHRHKKDMSVAILAVEQPTPFKMNIFPNPSYGSIHIELEHANVSATLVNAMGQVIWTSNDISETSFTLQVSELPKGLYVFRVHDDAATYAHKLIFE